MILAQPHFLLFCDTHLNGPPTHRQSETVGQPALRRSAGSGRWHFVLERLDGIEKLEATDSESAVNQDRLALLSVVRGLEALEQPSKVTLVTTSRYVSRGLRYGLNTWRDSKYTWERFGVQMPIRNSDLWQRIDCALSYHAVTCRLIQSELKKFENPPNIFPDASMLPAARQLPPNAAFEAANPAVGTLPLAMLPKPQSHLQAFFARLQLLWLPIWWKLAAIRLVRQGARGMNLPAMYGT